MYATRNALAKYYRPLRGLCIKSKVRLVRILRRIELARVRLRGNVSLYGAPLRNPAHSFPTRRWTSIEVLDPRSIHSGSCRKRGGMRSIDLTAQYR